MILPNYIFGQDGFQQAKVNELKLAVELLSETRFVGGTPLYCKHSLTELYKKNTFQFIWSTNLIDSLLIEIGKAESEGLNSNDYHYSTINELNGSTAIYSDLHFVQLELICSDAFLLYTSHLLYGKTNNYNGFTLRGKEESPVQLLLSLMEGNEFSNLITRIKPAFKYYRQLSDNLILYRQLLIEGGWVKVSKGVSLRKGMSDKRVLQIRERLSKTDGAKIELDSAQFFDETLEEAVKIFQRRHGLNDDGEVGSHTLQALNVSIENRIQQLIVNLERCRWLPSDLGDQYIMVNLPAYKLEVVKYNKTVLEMAVIIGKPDRPTPVFSAAMSYLVFNPYWTIPPTILYEDIIPVQAKNPNYLNALNIKVYNRSGQIIPPNTIRWNNYRTKGFPYTLKQDPGRNNALGKVKFIFPNPYNVYMHDTNHRELFVQNERAFSSGCIRLEKPVELANLLLALDKGWPTNKVQDLIQSDQNHTVVLSEPFQVYLQYWTAYIDESNVLNFRKDLYNKDAVVWKALKASPRMQ